MQLQIQIGSYLAFQEVPWSNWSGYDTRNARRLAWDPFAKNNALLSCNVRSPSCYEGRAYPLQVIRPACEMDLWEKTVYLTVCWSEVRVCRLKLPDIPVCISRVILKTAVLFATFARPSFRISGKGPMFIRTRWRDKGTAFIFPFRLISFLYRQVRALFKISQLLIPKRLKKQANRSCEPASISNLMPLAASKPNHAFALRKIQRRGWCRKCCAQLPLGVKLSNLIKNNITCCWFDYQFLMTDLFHKLNNKILFF